MDLYEVYWEKLGNYDNQAFKNAVDHIITTDERGFFPTVGLLYSMTDTFQNKIDDAEREQTKKDEREAARKFFQGELTGSEHAKQSCQLIRQAMAGELTRQQYLDGMSKLGHKTQRLKKYYEFSNLPLEQNIGEWNRKKGEGLNKVPLLGGPHD